MEYTADGH